MEHWLANHVSLWKKSENMSKICEYRGEGKRVLLEGAKYMVPAWCCPNTFFMRRAQPPGLNISRLIGGGRPAAWFSYLPNLNPLDFFILWHLKSVVFDKLVYKHRWGLHSPDHRQTYDSSGRHKCHTWYLQVLPESLSRRCRPWKNIHSRHLQLL